MPLLIDSVVPLQEGINGIIRNREEICSHMCQSTVLCDSMVKVSALPEQFSIRSILTLIHKTVNK